MFHCYLHNPVHAVLSTNERRKLIPKESRTTRGPISPASAKDLCRASGALGSFR